MARLLWVRPRTVLGPQMHSEQFAIQAARRRRPIARRFTLRGRRVDRGDSARCRDGLAGMATIFARAFGGLGLVLSTACGGGCNGVGVQVPGDGALVLVSWDPAFEAHQLPD